VWSVSIPKFVFGDRILLRLLVACLCSLSASGVWANGGPDKPNIVILLADDLGWNDVGYHGSQIKTPHIDQLAREGLELDRFYVAPWCSPTRAGLMTGRYPHRYGYQYVVKQMAASFLPLEAVTLAETLGQAGYKRRAIIGKWHLLEGDKGGHPLDQGFTEFYGMLGGSVDYFTHGTIAVTPPEKPNLDWHRNRELNYDQGYATDLLGDESVRFIKRSARDQPFFLYVAFNAPHIPLQAKGESLNPVPKGAVWSYVIDVRKNPDADLYKKIYAAMVSSLDTNIGKILTAIDDSGLRANTLVLFLNDNGGDITLAPGDNSPLRGGKDTNWEGGVRVPAAIRWPARLRGGKRIAAPMSYVDVLPTLAEVAGLPSPPVKNLGGVSVLDVLTGEGPVPDRQIYLGAGAVVDANWKLVGNELFAIKTDPGETTNVAVSHPDIVLELQQGVKKFEPN